MPKKPGFKIGDIYAWISTDEDGEEGVLGYRTEDGTMLPLIGADMDRIMSMQPYAARIQQLSGKPCRLVHFVLADSKSVEEVKPKK